VGRAPGLLGLGDGSGSNGNGHPPHPNQFADPDE
jgi:hypothetical protein